MNIEILQSHVFQATIGSEDTVDDTIKTFPETMTFEELGLVQNSGVYYNQQRSRWIIYINNKLMIINNNRKFLIIRPIYIFSDYRCRQLLTN